MELGEGTLTYFFPFYLSRGAAPDRRPGCTKFRLKPTHEKTKQNKTKKLPNLMRAGAPFWSLCSVEKLWNGVLRANFYSQKAICQFSQRGGSKELQRQEGKQRGP